MTDRDKVLILGASGMLGHKLLALLAVRFPGQVHASAREVGKLAQHLPQDLLQTVEANVDAGNFDTVIAALARIRPTVVINCIGIIKQLPAAKESIPSISVNALFPHRLAQLCLAAGARLIHISTDCVFAGTRGNYREDEPADAIDLYGRTKLIGEISEAGCLTLRTSIIGHELDSKYGLVDWFLSQKEDVNGFTNAIFSGLPTTELAHIISEYVLSSPNLQGIYHVSSAPISKYSLLQLIANKYSFGGKLVRFDDFHINRSLDASRFKEATGYEPPPWELLVDRMHSDFLTATYYRARQGKN